MKTKLVNRYYCEFCNKGGCSASHMSRHEKRCTKNPHRECGMCKAAREEPVDLATVRPLVEELSKAHDAIEIPLDVYVQGQSAEAIFKACNSCPACTLAAIRQFAGDTPFDFSFKDASKEFWSDLNDAENFAAN